VYAPEPAWVAIATGVAPVKLKVTIVGLGPPPVGPVLEPPPQPARRVNGARQKAKRTTDEGIEPTFSATSVHSWIGV
jgi:hypothetical protein